MFIEGRYQTAVSSFRSEMSKPLKSAHYAPKGAMDYL
jgi:hypothetical protein